MRKTFPMDVPGLQPPRVVEAIKSDVRKYIKRERRKKLPEGVDFCDFACRVGPDPDTAAAVHVAELNAAIDTAAREQWAAIHIEILAKAGYRTRKTPQPDAPGDE